MRGQTEYCSPLRFPGSQSAPSGRSIFNGNRAPIINTSSHRPQLSSSRALITPARVCAAQNASDAGSAVFQSIQMAGRLINIVLRQSRRIWPVLWLNADWAIILGRNNEFFCRLQVPPTTAGLITTPREPLKTREPIGFGRLLKRDTSLIGRHHYPRAGPSDPCTSRP